jgi:membrane dipeptidase
VHHHVRAKPDRVIKAICDAGGFVGVCCIPSFLGGSGDLNAMLDHILYAVRQFGADHVAIGTDVAYAARPTPAESQRMPKRIGSRPRWEKLWPPDPSKLPSAHPSLAWTNWPMFTVGMVQRGLSDDDIQKILGGNVLRVARAALAG